ncbi:MAG: Oxidoreductase, partial [Labilithrix sp.]|nr:Oxidoreductase [Labilithrix sp.]
EAVDSVFLVWPFFVVDAVAPLLEVLKRRGVRRIVYLSAASVRDDLEVQPGLFHADIERLIERSGLEWTFLRPTGFATNTLMWAHQIRTSSVVRWPYGAATRSLIHERDIASVAVRALTADGHHGAKYVLTGPEALTQMEQVELIGRAIGRPVRWEELSPETARQQLLADWGNPAFVQAALEGWAAMVAQPEPVTRTVEAIAQAPARTFGEWAIEHAADFR